MMQIDILLTSLIAGGTAPYHHGDLSVTFHLIDSPSALPLLEGATFAFVDWAMPDLSGMEFCRRLRCDPLTAKARITMVLACEDEGIRRQALRAGADDCMVGPCSRQQLLDKAMAGSGRDAELNQRNAIELGNLVLDLNAYQARWCGQNIPLMPNELRLLRFFIEHSGRVFTRQQLISALGKDVGQLDERTVDVWIGRLRRALAGAGVRHVLRTVRSLGYVFDVDLSASPDGRDV